MSKENMCQGLTRTLLYDECHGCKKRQIGCQSCCESYLAARKANDEANARRAVARKAADDALVLHQRRKKRIAQFYKK